MHLHVWLMLWLLVGGGFLGRSHAKAPTGSVMHALDGGGAYPPKP